MRNRQARDIEHHSGRANRRALGAIAVTIGLAAAIYAGASLAGDGSLIVRPTIEVNRATTESIELGASTTSTEFEPLLPGAFKAAKTCGRGPRGLLVHGSFELSGPGAVELRAVVYDAKRTKVVQKPFRFATGTERSTFSAHWSDSTGSLKRKFLRMEWRSPDGAPVTMHQYTATYLYGAKGKSKNCG